MARTQRKGAPIETAPERGAVQTGPLSRGRPRPGSLLGTARAAAPGLLLALAIAVVASFLARAVPLVGAAVIAILIGIAVRSASRLPAVLIPGVRLATKRVLQLSIVLLGTGLSLSQVWTTGRASVVVMLALARLLGVERTLARLISVGTGICGASAIGALAPAIDADGASIAYAISTVFLFNIAGVLLFPPLGHLLGLSQHGFGLWAGTAINDTSSVVAAAYVYGAPAGAYAVVVKLTRTVMIVPVTILFAVIAAREKGRGEGGEAGPGPRRIVSGLPLFIVWFLVASALNTLGVFHPLGARTLPALGQFCIVVALAGVGLSADLRAMARTGLRPVLLGLLGWVCVATTSLLLQRLTGGV